MHIAVVIVTTAKNNVYIKLSFNLSSFILWISNSTLLHLLLHQANEQYQLHMRCINSYILLFCCFLFLSFYTFYSYSVDPAWFLLVFLFICVIDRVNPNWTKKNFPCMYYTKKEKRNHSLVSWWNSVLCNRILDSQYFYC